jgi:hypothetical protein
VFGWLFGGDPVKKLEKKYQAAREHAEKELARSGDRAKHAELLAKAEEIGKELDALRAQAEA